MWRRLSVALVAGLCGCGFWPSAVGDTCEDVDTDCTEERGTLTELEFLEGLTDQFCDAWAACTTTDVACPLDEHPLEPEPDCTFDPDQADRCLSGVYTCESEGPGAEYVLPPQACNTVYTCDAAPL